MALFAEINGNRASSASIVLPYQGIWHADIELDQAVTLSGLVTLTVSDMVLKGSIYRQGTFLNSSSIRMVGGYLGWPKKTTAKEYRSSFGVKFSVIAGDAARETGEKIFIPSDFSVGEFYERQAEAAVRVLDTFADIWWMREDGVTVIGDRAQPIITSAFDVMSDGTSLAMGKITIATDKPGDWLPGVKFSSPTLAQKQASAIIHKLTKDKLRTEIWTL
jgi:hypothetical protein